MAAVIASAATGGWQFNHMLRLAEVLANSGTTISFASGEPVADVASTGGPASLSTLLCPIFLRAFGFVVPKLGVPGRPAGGIDVLAQVKGYKVALDPREVRRALDQCGYAHFMAGPEFAPLDASLFQYRQRIGAQEIPSLAVASILAKKIACGLTVAGLDVRVAPHGNFGPDFGSARGSSKILLRRGIRLRHRRSCRTQRSTQPLPTLHRARRISFGCTRNHRESRGAMAQRARRPLPSPSDPRCRPTSKVEHIERRYCHPVL